MSTQLIAGAEDTVVVAAKRPSGYQRQKAKTERLEKRLGGWQRKLLKQGAQIEAQCEEIAFLQCVLDLCAARLGKEEMARILNEVRNG